ncbi:MAG: SdpI family protein [Gemmatimonadaceae bacterium]
MRKWIPLLIIAASIIASVLVYPSMPQNVPTHWDLLGRPNGWSSRFWGAWLMPLFLIGSWAVIRILPLIDPRGSNYAKFGGAFEGIIVSVMLFMLGMHMIILRSALGYPVPMERVLPIGLGILFIAIGNLLPRARPNWFVGIRTPWTLSSDRVWEKTHRFGGQVFVAGGIVVLLSGLVMTHWAHVVTFCVISICALAVVIFSYLEWKREQVSAANPG